MPTLRPGRLVNETPAQLLREADRDAQFGASGLVTGHSDAESVPPDGRSLSVGHLRHACRPCRRRRAAAASWGHRPGAPLKDEATRALRPLVNIPGARRQELRTRA
jgi:hypothetical protein